MGWSHRAALGRTESWPSKLSGEQSFGPCPVDEGRAVTREECLVVAEKIDNSRSFGLFNDICAHAPAHQLERPGERDSALLSVTPGGAIVDAGRQSVQFRVSKRGRFPDVAVAPSKASVVLGEKLQERYR